MRCVVNLTATAFCPCGAQIDVMLWSDPEQEEQPIRWKYTRYCEACGKRYTVTAQTSSAVTVEHPA